MLTILHTSDWQLGMTRHFLDDQAQADYASARLCAVRTMAEVARRSACACCVVAGDVFESNQVDRQTVARTLEALDAFEVPVLLLPGNHDPDNAASVYRGAAFEDHRPGHVHVLGAEPVQIGDLEVVGAPWTSKHPGTDLVRAALDRLDDRPAGIRVLVGHGQVREGHPHPDDPTLVSLAAIEEAIEQGKVHYVALGDRHSVTSHGATGRVWHSGTPVQTDYDEADPNHALVVALGATVSVTPERVGTWEFVDHAAELDGIADVDALGRWLESLPDKHERVVRLSLAGGLSLSASRRLDALVEHHASLFGAVTVANRRALVVHADDTDLADLDVSGFARSALERLDTLARSESDDAPVAAEALGLLYRLTVGAR